jgi:hypothetical protein
MVPSRTTNSNETIAKGATMAAVQLSGLFKFSTFEIVNKTNYTIKLQCTSSGGKSEMEGECVVNDTNECPPCFV